MPEVNPAGPGSVRHLASGLSAILAGLHLLIGLEVLTVAGVTEVEPGPAVPLVIAGALFVIPTALLVWLPRRPVWIAGAVYQVLLLFVGYLASARREIRAPRPGGGLQLLELALLGVLLSLVARPAGRRAGVAGGE